MPHQSRLGTFSLNTSYLGLFTQALFIFIGGVDRTGPRAPCVVKGSIKITKRRGRASRCTFATRQLQVTAGQEVVVRNGGSGTNHLSGQVIYRGRIISVEQVSAKSTPGAAVWHQVTCSDEWFLDRFDVVTRLYHGGRGINGVVADILDTYTDGGYASGDVSENLGAVRAVFSYAKVSSALRRLAAAGGGFLHLDPRALHVSILTGVSDGHAITLDDADTDHWGFRFESDLSQVRTRVIVQGRSTRLALATEAGATTLTVDDVDDFDPTGGKGRIRGTEFSYTGIDPTNRQLTGVSNLTSDGAVGDEVHLVVQVDDTAAQTSLATLLGGGASGVVTHYINNNDLSAGEAEAAATEDLDLFSSALPRIAYATRNRFYAIPGKTVTVSKSNPYTLSAAATIESVEIRARAETPDDRLPFEYRVRAAPNEDRLIDLLTGSEA